MSNVCGRSNGNGAHAWSGGVCLRCGEKNEPRPLEQLHDVDYADMTTRELILVASQDSGKFKDDPTEEEEAIGVETELAYEELRLREVIKDDGSIHDEEGEVIAKFVDAEGGWSIATV